METRSRSPGRRPGRRRKSPVVVISSSSRKSPSRKSPARKTSPGKSKIIEKSTSKDKTENKVSSKDDKLRSSPTRHLKIRLDKISSSTTTTTKIIKSSTDTIDIGSSISPPSRPSSDISYNQSKSDDISGDSEILKITSFPISSLTRRSVSVTKLTPSTHHLTPTPSVTATSTDRHSRSVSRSVYDASKTEYSDDDDEHVPKDDSQSSYSNYRFGDNINTGGLFKNSYTKLTNVSRNISTPREYGGIIGCVFLLIFIPFFTYYLQWTCENTNSCNFKKIKIPTTLPKSISDILPDLNLIENIFTKNTVYAYIIYTISLFILSSVIRIGYEVKLPPSDRGIIRYNFNALSISILVTIIFFIFEILQYDIANFIYKNYLKLMIFNILSALLLSIWYLIRSNFIQDNNQWNHYGKSGNILIDYCQGREINPKWLNLIDYKLIFNRISLITTLLLIEVLIYKNLQLPKIQPTTTTTTTIETNQTIIENLSSIKIIDTIQYYYKNTNIIDTSSLFSALLVLIYISDSIIFEHHLATSFELQQEGCGSFLMLRYAITPFLLISIPKYLFDIKPINLSWWIIIFSIILLIIGLLIKRKSNSIKYRYRLNPYNKETAYMDTLPTFQGKRLLLGKLWGNVRQPNYIGDIIALISLLLPLFGKFAWPPFISIILIIIYLIHRAYRVNLRNFSRYNSAWQRYCTKVRYILIPKVY